jgi:uncharacterized protein involved in exopolysaccharide biosynthesis
MLTSLSQWWKSLVNHCVVAVLAFSAVVALTVCVILYAPREYRSRSRLLLRIGHESATLDPTAQVLGDAITPLHTREDEVETAIGVMHSRSIMEDVVDQLGTELILDEKPPADEPEEESEEPGLVSRIIGPLKAQLSNIDPVSDREMAIRALENGFDISAANKSSLVTIEFRSKHPAVAQDIVNAWVESYVGHHARVNRTQGTYDFFAQQDVQLKEQLVAAHQALKEAKVNAGFATLEGQQKLLEAQLQNVRTELLNVDASLAESSSRIESFQQLLASSIEKTTTEETSGLANDARDTMRGSLFELEVLENEYAAKYKESHPKLVAIREQLANAKKIVDLQDKERKEIRQVANPTHQQISETRLLDVASNKALREKRVTLQQQQQSLTDEIKQLNQYEEQLAGLTRNAEILEERYKQHATLFEQARLNEVLEAERITSINVVQAASLEERPVTPDKKISAMVGLFAAFAVAVSLPVLLDARKLFFAQPEGAHASVDQHDQRQVSSGQPASVSLTGGKDEESGELVTTDGSLSAKPR